MNETKMTAGHNYLGTLAKDARSLVSATTEVPTPKLGDVRQRVVEETVSHPDRT